MLSSLFQWSIISLDDKLPVWNREILVGTVDFTVKAINFRYFHFQKKLASYLHRLILLN